MKASAVRAEFTVKRAHIRRVYMRTKRELASKRGWAFSKGYITHPLFKF